MLRWVLHFDSVNWKIKLGSKISRQKTKEAKKYALIVHADKNNLTSNGLEVTSQMQEMMKTHKQLHDTIKRYVESQKMSFMPVVEVRSKIKRRQRQLNQSYG